MHFLITGHTGFKGAWLILLLRRRGYEVSGISLPAVQGSLYESAQIGSHLQREYFCDIRDGQALNRAFQSTNPDVVIHLAAQALVNEGYRDPLTTYETNILGTLNVLEATSKLADVRAQLIVTTDKVYKDTENYQSHVETDELGGTDPYSASKTAADILTQSWINRFPSPPTAIARAGNVIGGGDVCRERLVPDLISAYSQNRVPELRYPNAIRPWQYVLDCLNGYLMLIDHLLEGDGLGAWNFGPSEIDVRTVSELAERIAFLWGKDLAWKPSNQEVFLESSRLILNTEKSRSRLGWHNKLNFDESLDWTVAWYQNVNRGIPSVEACNNDISTFETL